MVELCAGTANLTYGIIGGHNARFPISRQGSKLGYRQAIAHALGLRMGQGADAVVFVEADSALCRAHRLLVTPEGCRAVAAVIRGWVGEDARALWDRLRAEPVPEGEAEAVGAWMVVNENRSPAGFFNAQKIGAPGSRRPQDCTTLAGRFSALRWPPVQIIEGDAAGLDPREVALLFGLPAPGTANLVGSAALDGAEGHCGGGQLFSADQAPRKWTATAGIVTRLHAARLRAKPLTSLSRLEDDLATFARSLGNGLLVRTLLGAAWRSLDRLDAIPLARELLSASRTRQIDDSAGDVSGAMLPLGDEFEITDVVVASIPINVMHMLSGDKRSPDVLLHDPTMLPDLLAVPDDARIISHDSTSFDTSTVQPLVVLVKAIRRNSARDVARWLYLDWPPTIISNADASTVEPGILPAGTVVYMDPNYQGTTGYRHSISREQVLTVAQRWADAGALVCVSEAEPLDLPGWYHVDITGCRVGQKRTFSKQQSEWLTMSRPPAVVPMRQEVLL